LSGNSFLNGLGDLWMIPLAFLALLLPPLGSVHSQQDLRTKHMVSVSIVTSASKDNGETHLGVNRETPGSETMLGYQMERPQDASSL
jgi:hypothetical protein